MARSEQAQRIAKYRFQPKKYDVVTPEQARYAAETEGRDIRKEYQQMRRTAEKRIARLAKSGFADTEIYKANVNRFPRLTEIGTDTRLLYDAMAEVTHFLAQRKSTVYGYHEQEEQAIEKFAGHYASEGLVGLDWNAFGAMMGAIKSHAQSNAYYRRWKNAYRAAVSRAEKLGMTAKELSEKVAQGAIKIGVAGGLLDATGRSIRKGWAGLGK